MGTETNNTQANHNDGVAPEPTKVTFSEQQQARIDEIVREAQGRAARELRQELTEAKQRLTEMQQQREAIASGKEPHPAVEEAQHRIKQLAIERDTAVNHARDIERRVLIQAAASKLGFIDPTAVSKLTSDQVKYDDTRGKFIVVNEQGTERMNSAFEPMSLEEFYAEFASKNPYLVRGSTIGGSGSSESQRSGLSNIGKYEPKQIFGRGSNAALANKLAKEDPKEYARLKHAAREEGLVG